tara:strand:- start:2561 stop:2812 length:252 start_codon:yes stop_codon:yes gene_type:complete
VDSLYFLIPIALVFVVIAIRLLFWAINSGQYDNLDTEAHRILFDDDAPEATDKNAPPADSEQTADEAAQPVTRSARAKDAPHD